MTDILMGTELVTLPPSYKRSRGTPFRAAERILYSAFCVRLRELRTVDLDPKDERKGLQNLLAQLTRLRQ